MRFRSLDWLVVLVLAIVAYFGAVWVGIPDRALGCAIIVIFVDLALTVILRCRTARRGESADETSLYSSEDGSPDSELDR